MAKIEVVETVTQRRRSYTRDEKQALLAECDETTMSDVARRHGISRSVLQRWKTGRARGDGRVLQKPVASPFVRLALPHADTVAPATSAIRIQSRAGVSIELPADIDLAQLAAFVRLLDRSDGRA